MRHFVDEGLKDKRHRVAHGPSQRSGGHERGHQGHPEFEVGDELRREFLWREIGVGQGLRATAEGHEVVAKGEQSAAGIDAVPTPYSPLGLRLAGKPALHKVDVFARGDVEVQDEGSQLLALLADAKRGEMVADFCAGAGGKTLALGAAMRNTGRLYAFDVSGHRLAALKPRLARSGLSNVYPVQIAHERDERIKRLAGKLDRVLVDAPCSGLGILRRDPDIRWRRRETDLPMLAATQLRMLGHAAEAVAPGGRLIYATCSSEPEENEAVADAFLAATSSFAAVDARQASPDLPGTLVDTRGHFRTLPHAHGLEAFFGAVFQRRP